AVIGVGQSVPPGTRPHPRPAERIPGELAVSGRLAPSGRPGRSGRGPGRGAVGSVGVHRRHPAAPDDRRTQRLGPRRAGGGRAHGPARGGAVSYPVGWTFAPAYRPFRCGGAPVDVRGGPCRRFTAGGDRRVAGTCPVLRVVGRRRG